MILSSENRLGLLLCGLVLFTGILYHETALALWNYWLSRSNQTYSHGPILLAVIIFILYQRWNENKDKLRIRISFIGLAGLSGSSLLWFLASIGYVQTIQMLSLLFIYLFIFISILGIHQTKPFYFPIILLLGAIPVWEVFGHYLRLNTAIVSGWLASLTIHPSFREGMLIHIPAGTFRVDPGCSGLAIFIVSIIISLLYTYFRHIPVRKTMQLVFIAIAIAIIANIIRVYIIVLSGQLTNMQSTLITQGHAWLGWVLFIAGMSIYFWLTERYIVGNVVNLPGNNKCDETVIDDNSSMNVHDLQFSDTDVDVNTVDANKKKSEKKRITHEWYWMIIIVAAFVIIGPVANQYYKVNPRHTDSKIVLPNKINDWEKIPYSDTYQPVLKKGDLFYEISYRNKLTNSRINLLVNHFYFQHQGYEAVSNMNHINGNDNWTRISSNVINPELSGFNDIGEIHLLGRNGEKRLVWYWYKTNQSRTSRPWLAKIENIIGIIRGKPSISMLVLSVDPVMGMDNARTTLQNFTKQIDPDIHIYQ